MNWLLVAYIATGALSLVWGAIYATLLQIKWRRTLERWKLEDVLDLLEQLE